MIQLPYLFAYVAIGAFALVVLARIMRWARMPMHMRWELYPVAHESRKAHYGGSYLEESEWWKKPRETSLWGELKVMVPEIFFLVALRENNRKLWIRSFPFHFGLYLVVGCTFLMAASGILSGIAPAFLEGIRGIFLQPAIAVTGGAGVLLGILGALGLLQQRLTNSDLRDYTAPADVFNLLFFIVVFGIAFAHFALFDPDFAATTLFVRNLITGNMEHMKSAGAGAVLPAMTVCGMSLLVIYIPLTHMSHFIGKYFAYHSIRWNDSPNMPGGKEENKIRALLERPVSWSAPHIRGNGNRSWFDLAAESSREDQNK